MKLHPTFAKILTDAHEHQHASDDFSTEAMETLIADAKAASTEASVILARAKAAANGRQLDMDVILSICEEVMQEAVREWISSYPRPRFRVRAATRHHTH